jgi:protein-L-isoaspartate(D-aspartate) O-methyltransferase
MAPTIDRFESARTHMVDSQIRPNKVTDPMLIAALRALPREAFVPASEMALAYADCDIRLGVGRVMPEPMVMARLVQLASPRAGERVLVVGSGTGYGAALIGTLLAKAGGRVVALEERPDIAAIGVIALTAHAPDVVQVTGDLLAGCPAHAPYDLIVIEGAVEAMPGDLVAQLAPTGRLVMVRNTASGVGQAVLGRPVGGAISFVPVFDATLPTLPSFRHAAGFVF